MQFENLADFISMDGHGVFVWSVYVTVLVVLTFMFISPLLKKRRFMVEQSMHLRRAAIQKEQTSTM